MSLSQIPAELEAKLLAPGESTLRAIARLADLGAYRAEVRDTVRLHSLYLDTNELALARQGIALRLRRCGRRWEATVKWEGRIDGDLHERPELTVALRGRPQMPFELKHPQLLEYLAARVAGRPLRTILVTDIRRTRIDVRRRDAGAEAEPLAEIALDRVHLHGDQPGDAEARYCEIEVERLAGSREDVVQIAAVLRHGFGLYPSTESKFSRGIALLHHPQWLGVPSTGLVTEDTVVSAARKIASTQLEQLRVHDPGARRGENPEEVHAMRVASRRLRAALSMFRAAFAPKVRAHLRDELKWLRRSLGRVRDIDVQLQRVTEFAASTPASLRSSLEAYSRYLERRRADYRKEMLTSLTSPRYFGLLERLEKFATGAIPVADEVALRPVGGMAADAIKRAYRRVRKRGRKVHAEPTPEDLHELRIRAKRLRYVLEFCDDLSGREGRRAVRRLVKLQDLLGAFHDAVVSADFVRQYVDGAGKRAGSAALITMGAFLAQALHRADAMRSDFARTWKRFERRRTRREFDAILRKLDRDGGRTAPAVIEPVPAAEPAAESSPVEPATSVTVPPTESAKIDFSHGGLDERRPPAKRGAASTEPDSIHPRTAGGHDK